MASVSMEPHWAEGMLLLPHHLQCANRYLHASLAALWANATPFPWGFEELVISDAQVRAGTISVERCRARTPEGTWIVVPGNTELAARPLEDFITQSPDGLMVFLAIPKVHEIRPNAAYEPHPNGQPTRNLIQPFEVRDENTGDNEQQIEVHAVQARLLFGEERNTPGFEVLPLLRVYLSGEEGGVPRVDTKYIPPLLRIGASSDLQSLIADIVHEVGARNRELTAEAKKHEMSFRSGIDEHVERLLMIHVLNGALGSLRQMTAVVETKPFAAYSELCRLAGELSVFSPDRTIREYPVYNHSKIGEQFHLLCDHIGVLLRAFGVGRVKWRDFEQREGGEGLQVQLDEAWLSGRRELYIGVHCTTMGEIELDGVLKRLDWKVASIDDVDRLFRAGLRGLELRPVRTATGILPASPEIKYYQVLHHPEHWPKVVETQVLAMRYSPDAKAQLENVKFRMYIILERQEAV